MTTLLAVLAVLSLAIAGLAARLLSAYRYVRVYREAAGEAAVDSGDPILRSARDLLIGADGYLASGQSHLFREVLGFRRTDHRVLDLLHATGDVMMAIEILKGANWQMILDLPTNVATLADPIAEYRLAGLWPVTTLLERLPRPIRGAFCYLRLRGPIGRLRADVAGLLEAINSRLALSTWNGGERDDRGDFASYLELHSAKNQLISAQGDLVAARGRLFWELLGLDDGDRRQADLLRATADIHRGWFAATRSLSRYDVQAETPSIPGFLDPVVASALEGRWIFWAVLVLSPGPVRGIYRAMKLRPQILELQVTVDELLESFDVAIREDREPVAVAAK